MSQVFFLPIKETARLSELATTAGLTKTLQPEDFVAVKIHFGEAGNIGFIKPHLVKPVVELIKTQKAVPFLTDASTIYKGQRSDAVRHSVIAAEHGFNLENCGAPVVIADGLRGNSFVPVEIKQKHFQEVKIAHDIYYADSLVAISHFKGHELSGFGGALKNLGMGCGAKAGKYEMHNNVLPVVDQDKCRGCQMCTRWCPAEAIDLTSGKAVINPEICIGCADCILSCPYHAVSIKWNESFTNVQEKIVEYAAGVLANKKNKGFYFNFINFLTPQCDCYPTGDSKPLLKDIGITASLDPVSIDQASVDLVNKTAGRDLFREVYPNIDWSDQLQYAEKLGLGERKYELIEL